MEELPDDTIFVVFTFLTRDDIFCVCRTNKNWEFSKLARRDRIWEQFYQSFLEDEISLDALSSTQRKKVVSSESFFEKYRRARLYWEKSVGFIFSKKHGIWVKASKEHLLRDKDLQVDFMKRILHDQRKVDIRKTKDQFKVVFVGDGSVGKTSMIIRLCQNRFTCKYIPTYYDNNVAKFSVLGRLLGINLWDTAGQEDYDTLRPLSYQETDVFILCYDISNPSSLAKIDKMWVDEVTQYSEKAGLVICCCKYDLKDDKEFHVQMKEKNKNFSRRYEFRHRILERREGIQMAKKHWKNVNVFIETSSKSGLNVENTLKKSDSDDLYGLAAAMFYSFLMSQVDGKGSFGYEKKEKRSDKCVVI